MPRDGPRGGRAGVVTSGASYSYETGPDGRRHAVGGEVGINQSPGARPKKPLSRAEKIRAAALAPADPSGQDRQIAARASRMAAEACVELATVAAMKGPAGLPRPTGWRRRGAAGDRSGPRHLRLIHHPFHHLPACRRDRPGA